MAFYGELLRHHRVRKGAELGQMVYDGETAVITGRQPLSYVDATIKKWRSQGGDQIRKEYEQALKKSHQAMLPSPPNSPLEG